MSLTPLFFYLLFLFFLFAVPRLLKAGVVKTAPAKKVRASIKRDKDQPAKKVKRGKDLPEIKKNSPKTSSLFLKEELNGSESSRTAAKVLQDRKTDAEFSLRQAVLYQEILRLPKALRRIEDR
jgi:hypothetical protein